MDLILISDYVGTFVFAISGTLTAAQKRLDIFGAMMIGFATAVGGGTLRDMMLGVMPVTWIRSIDYFLIVMLGVVVTAVFQRFVLRLKSLLFLLDAIGIGVFTLIGIEKSTLVGINPPIAILMGLSTAVVGGVIRDTLCNEVPLIFHKEIYATACIIGGIVYFVLAYLECPTYLIHGSTVICVIAVRVLAVHLGISLPIISLKDKNDSN